MKNLFYFLVGFLAAGLLTIASAKAEELSNDELIFKKGCQYTLVSLNIDSDLDFMRRHCEHLTNIYIVEARKNSTAKESRLIKAIKTYNTKQKTRRLNDGLIDVKKAFRIA